MSDSVGDSVGDAVGASGPGSVQRAPAPLLHPGHSPSLSDSAGLAAAVDSLRHAAPDLHALSTRSVATDIAAAVSRWLGDDPAQLECDVAEIAAESGHAPAMVRWSLEDLGRRLGADSLIALVEAELGSREPFGSPRSFAHAPCQRVAMPPRLLHTVLAETVLPVAIEVVVLGLLARAPHLIKTATGEHAAVRAFVAALERSAPHLARHVAVASWSGARQSELGHLAVGRADVVVVYGHDATVDQVQAMCRFPTRCYGYGQRLSFAVLGPAPAARYSAALDELVLGLGLDQVAYAQRGCMSPQVVFVAAGAPWTPAGVAELLATRGLPEARARLGAGSLGPGAGAALQQARALAEFGGARAWLSEAGLVVAHPRFVLPSQTLPGALHVVPFDDLDSLAASLRPLAQAISTVGLWWVGVEREQVLMRLAELGARRVCRPGRMQRPLWVRDHDGRPRIGDWVEWMDVEPS